MGHVIGFGTVWNLLGLLQNPSDPAFGGIPGADTHFDGPDAIAAFNTVGGSSYAGAKVPVENDNSTFGTGSLDSHWRESVFDSELMSPSVNVGANPLSEVTVASLGDLGYVVNPAGADPYTLPGAPLRAGPLVTINLGDDVWLGPIYVVDAAGNLTRIRQR